ncbi:MAG TPA: hypothetical protein VL551_04045 [Actinospica sp.]|jgi:hypothetical protein|nr:hypothetical protein [Actinospica sp.]
MPIIPLAGCCNSCHEPVTNCQEVVLFEGPNLRYPQLGPNSAVFHMQEPCRVEARRYDECWALAVPGRVQKFPGWYSGEAWLRLLEVVNNTEPSGPGVPVTLLMTGGAHDGASMAAEATEEITEVLCVEAVPRPRAPEPGVWYVHANDCPCAAAGLGTMTAGEHLYRPNPDHDTGSN